ncbi:MAG: translation initiation factor IF-5A [Promethearchaeota archaeon]|nr:MAG: translation initiation factor IF-5A [Candidatus Lokiarchaeota archaeon]
MSIRRDEIQKLKSGNYIMVDGEPCEIKSTERSKSGKHGHAKVRVVCVGVFDDKKRSLTFPSGDLVDVPIIEKGNAQINFINDDKINILDLETYQSIDVDWPEEEGLRNKLKELQGDPEKMSNAKMGFWRLAGNIIIKRIL